METLPPEVVPNILSYCDLRTLAILRRVSKQFGAWSDSVPKRSLNVSDLSNPNLHDIGCKIAAALAFAGTDLLSFTGNTETTSEDEKKQYLPDLPRLLPKYCPNLKALHLPRLRWSSEFEKSVFANLIQHSPALRRLEEITAEEIPWELVAALPVVTRLNGKIGILFGSTSVDPEAMALKLCKCEHIESIDLVLICMLAKNLVTNPQCPAILGLSNVIEIRPDVGRKLTEDMYTNAARLFPRAFFKVTMAFDKDARLVSQIAGRIKEASLFFDEKNWKFEEEAPAMSHMISITKLVVSIYPRPNRDYSTFFSFLPHLEQLDVLVVRFSLYDFPLYNIIDMLPRFTAVKSLIIKYSDFDLVKLSPVLSQRGLPLEKFHIVGYNVFGTCQPTNITTSILAPIFEASPGIQNLFLSPCTVDVFKFAPQCLTHLSDFYCDPGNVQLALDLAGERIQSGKITPKLIVRLRPLETRMDMEQENRLLEAGIVIDSYNHRSFE